MAGTVTLGALPCAAADHPTVQSSVTEDETSGKGVAASIDGSAGTITVGTEGGGASPEIHGPWQGGSVDGSWYQSAAPSFTLTGGRALIRSGKMGNVSGAHGNLTSGGALRVLNGEALITGGTMGDVYGSYAKVVASGSADVAAEAAQSRVTVTGGEVRNELHGGYANVSTNSGAAHAAARGNRIYLRGGSCQSNIYGGRVYVSSPSGTETAIAEGNTVYISGGTYNLSSTQIFAGSVSTTNGTAIVRNNTIEITGAPGLVLPYLVGADAAGATMISENNALIIRNTKNISAVSVDKFQRYTFYAPLDLAESDAMLSLTGGANVDLSGALVEAYLPGGMTARELTLLHAGASSIVTNAATTMNVYEGVSGTLLDGIYVDGTGKKLLVRRDGAFRPNEDNVKSLAETMAGSAAFLCTGANLLAGAGMSNASREAAEGDGFAPFAAISGSSMHHETGSYVEVKGMNLAVGFAREVRKGGDRLLFGPLVEYGRGNYDSHVNAVHGDGTVKYLGGGVFLRKEEADGMFYEGSLRFGRAKMDYAANIPMGSGTVHTSYDTDANYTGAHLGLGRQVTAKNGTSRETYLRYFYTRQNGSSAKLSTGEHYDFSAVNSHRLRTGMRWTIPKQGGSLIFGTALQYEFGGDASATYLRPGGLSYTSPSPSLKGFSGGVELGWKAAMSENATANVALEGWMGKQRGVSLNAGFEWMF